jgi:hypothetical protein
MEVYCNHLYNEYGFAEFFENENRKRYFRGDREVESFKAMTIAISNSEQVNLRQIERVFAYARLALMQFKENNFVLPNIYFLLCFWKVMNPDFYNKIRTKELSNQELLSHIERILPKKLLITDKYQTRNRGIYYTIASLIYCYDITTTDEGGVRGCTIESIRNEIKRKNEFTFTTLILDKDLFDEALNWYCNESHSREYEYGLSFIFNRIDLLERFEI